MLLAIFAGDALAQTTFASFTGIVTDASGAVLTGAKVTATNTETGIATTAESGESGNYTIPRLKEGSYTVRVQAPGFREFVAQNVVLTSRDVRRLDRQLDVGTSVG